MIVIRITRRGRVQCTAVMRVPLSSSMVWGQIRDFRTFASLEYFHAKIDIAGDVPRAGAALEIAHRFLVFHVHRVGRICRWKEGDGFAFSDLSRRGLKSGFPHIFSYRIRPISPGACDVQIRVAGKWTASFVPRWLAWLWLRWIMQFAIQQFENKLMAYRLWLAAPNQFRGRDV